MHAWARSWIFVVALVSSACSPPPEEVTTGLPASSDTSDGPTTTATPGTATATTTTATNTTTTGEGSDTSSHETTTTDTTMGVVDSTSDEGSSGGSSSGPEPACTGPESCGSNQECVEGRCVQACGGTWGEGSYGYCLTEYGDFDTAAICGDGHLCVYWGSPIEQTACALQGCASACDCPPPPGTGTAVVTCSDITDPDELADCYLSCQNGETCPDDMVCTINGVCVTAAPELPVYGDCGNLAPDCAAPAFCVDVPGGESVCTLGCADAIVDCPMAIPPGGTAMVACTDVVPATPGFECYLDCIGGASCPDGMTCVNGTLCMWQD
jgi:hypothetical protein